MNSVKQFLRGGVLGASALGLVGVSPVALADATAGALASASLFWSADPGIVFDGSVGNDSFDLSDFAATADGATDNGLGLGSMDLLAEAGVWAMPTPLPGSYGYSDQFSFGSLTMENTTASDATVSFELYYDISGDAEADSYMSTEYAYASAFVALDKDGDGSDDEVFDGFGDAFASGVGFDDADFVDFDGLFFDIVLAAGDVMTMDLTAGATAEASSTVVPVPAALPMALGAFGLLGMMARRRGAA